MMKANTIQCVERALMRRVLARSSVRRAARGVTLVEVLIVVAIMAMIAGGVSLVALPKFREAQKSTAETSAKQLRRAIQNWQRVNNEISCPTISQLIDSREVDLRTPKTSCFESTTSKSIPAGIVSRWMVRPWN